MPAQRSVVASAVCVTLAFLGMSSAAADSTAAASNLLQNPGFESDLAGWTNGSGAIVTSPVHSGGKARLINARSSAAQTNTQTIAVTGGMAYHATGWIKVANVAAGARIQVQWRSHSGSLVRIVNVGATLTGTADWVYRSASLAAPSGASQARFVIRVETETDNSGQAWFDDLSFGSPTPADSSGSSESAMPDYVVEGVTTSPSPATLTAGQLASFGATVRNAGDGAASVSSSTRLRLDVGNNGSFDVTAVDQTTAALAAGSTETEMWSEIWTATAGMHTAEICVDLGSAVGESDEANNCTRMTFSVASSSSSPSPTPTAPASPCSTGSVVRVAAGANLTAVAETYPAGTTFCLADGTFVLTDKVVPQPGDAFIGAGRDKTFIRPAGIASPSNGFVPPSWGLDGKKAVTYQALDIGGFTARATSTSCNNSCGTAIWNKGDSLTGGVILRDVRCHDNGTSCVGHGLGSVLAENIECDRNGFHPDSLLGDYRSSACIKMTEGSLTLRNSYIHDNAYDAIWCDFCAHTVFLVENNVIVRNGRSGVHWEASGHFEPGDHAIVRNNEIRGNGTNCGPTGSEIAAGVIVEDSQNILIEGNTFGRNSACESGGFRGVRMWDSPNRAPAHENIAVRDNTLNGDSIHSCSSKGVVCATNA